MQLEHIVADYTVVALPGYTVVVPPSVAEVQTAIVLKNVAAVVLG